MIEITWDHSLMREMAVRLAAYLNENGRPAAVVRGREFTSHLGTTRLYSAIHVRRRGEDSYALIDFRDAATPQGNPIARLTVHDPNCRLVLKGQYRPSASLDFPRTKLRPYTYYEMKPRLFQRLLPSLRGSPRRYDKLYFRGRWANGREAVLTHLSDLLVEPTEERLSVADYYRDCAAARLGLSLPGNGNVCYREIEYFGLGVPTLMPRLKNTFHEPLIPNVHYLAVETATRTDGRGGAEAAAAIRDAYERHRADEELHRFVADNARAWYDRNVWLPNCVPLTAQLLGLM